MWFLFWQSICFVFKFKCDFWVFTLHYICIIDKIFIYETSLYMLSYLNHFLQMICCSLLSNLLKKTQQVCWLMFNTKYFHIFSLMGNFIEIDKNEFVFLFRTCQVTVIFRVYEIKWLKVLFSICQQSNHLSSLLNN